MTSRTWDHIAGACIVIALAFLLAVAAALLGFGWRSILLPLGLILFLTVVVPLLLSGLAVILSHQRYATPNSGRPDSKFMFARSKRAARIAGLSDAVAGRLARRAAGGLDAECLRRIHHVEHGDRAQHQRLDRCICRTRQSRSKLGIHAANPRHLGILRALDRICPMLGLR